MGRRKNSLSAGTRKASCRGPFAIDHFVQQVDDGDPFSRIQGLQGQVADFPGSWGNALEQIPALRRQLYDDFASVVLIGGLLDQASGCQTLQNAAYGGLIDGSGFYQFGLGAGTAIAQGAQGNELNGRQLFVADMLLENRRMPLAGFAQQVADMLGGVLGRCMGIWMGVIGLHGF